MQERNSQRTNPGFVLQFKILKFLCLFTCLIMKIKELQSQKIITTRETNFCYNSSLEGFRLNATVLEVRNVSSRSECVDDCLAVPCCRSINYKHSTSPNYEPNKCEFLHDLVENTSFVLEENTSFDHFFFISPQKEYNSSCFPVIETSYISCKEVFEANSSALDGVYNLQLNETSETYPAYCHMSNLSSQCGGGGWTLVMNLDGDKETFEYNSSFWTNNATWNVKAGLDGLTENEIKLASYHNTPFTEICLGMTVKNDTNWILLNHTASSLYSVIADGNDIATNAGREEWVSLINGSSLQPNCSKEGFNLKLSNVHLRIGFAGNNEDDCKSPDSFIGFGINRNAWNLSSGNINSLEKIILKAFGYILVR